MKNNSLIIQINKPLNDVFLFTITPPNSTRWIPSIIKEETNEWPIKKGTIYKLTNDKGEISEVIVVDIKEDEFVEWISKDQNYHCRYEFKSLNKNTTEFKYYEWVDRGEIQEPFTIDILEKLKLVVLNDYLE